MVFQFPKISACTFSHHRSQASHLAKLLAFLWESAETIGTMVKILNCELHFSLLTIQRAVAQIRMTPQAVILAESAVNIISWLPNRFLHQNTAETQE